MLEKITSHGTDCSLVAPDELIGDTSQAAVRAIPVPTREKRSELTLDRVIVTVPTAWFAATEKKLSLRTGKRLDDLARLQFAVGGVEFSRLIPRLRSLALLFGTEPNRRRSVIPPVRPNVNFEDSDAERDGNDGMPGFVNGYSLGVYVCHLYVLRRIYCTTTPTASENVAFAVLARHVPTAA